MISAFCTCRCAIAEKWIGQHIFFCHFLTPTCTVLSWHKSSIKTLSMILHGFPSLTLYCLPSRQTKHSTTASNYVIFVPRDLTFPDLKIALFLFCNITLSKYFYLSFYSVRVSTVQWINFEHLKHAICFVWIYQNFCCNAIIYIYPIQMSNHLEIVQ